MEHLLAPYFLHGYKLAKLPHPFLSIFDMAASFAYQLAPCQYNNKKQKDLSKDLVWAVELSFVQASLIVHKR